MDCHSTVVLALINQIFVHYTSYILLSNPILSRIILRFLIKWGTLLDSVLKKPANLLCVYIYEPASCLLMPSYHLSKPSLMK